MSFEILSSLLIFAFVSTITPGPNNVMLLASGVNFGLRASLPHMAGVLLGHGVMNFAAALGLGASLQAWPEIGYGLKLASAAYMVWLAWRMAKATPVPQKGGPEPSPKARSKPMGFWQAAAFQWVNPKAWVMSLVAATIFLPAPSVAGAVLIVLGFIVAGVPSLIIWVWLGQGLSRFLRNPIALSAFNTMAALLLLLSIYPILAISLAPQPLAP